MKDCICCGDIKKKIIGANLTHRMNHLQVKPLFLFDHLTFPPAPSSGYILHTTPAKRQLMLVLKALKVDLCLMNTD